MDEKSDSAGDLPGERRANATLGEIVAAMAKSLHEQAAAVTAAGGYQTPEGPYRGILPEGKRFFTVDQAAQETALAVHPRQGDDAGSSRVSNVFFVHAGDRSRRVFLTDEQLQELDRIWSSAGLPPQRFPMTQDAFAAYALVLEKSARGGDWALCPVLRDREFEASILRVCTRDAHAVLLRQAIAAGAVEIRHPATMTPVGAAAAGDNALIRRADLVKFAASMPEPIELVDEQMPDEDTGAADGADVQAKVSEASLDTTLLAVTADLVDAFGIATGMTKQWFTSYKLRDAADLGTARKVKGRGGRNSMQPLYCPFEVMAWLVNSKHRQGRELSEARGWQILETHFPKVYKKHSAADPR